MELNDTLLDALIKTLSIAEPTNVYAEIVDPVYDDSTYQSIAYIQVDYGDITLYQILAVHIELDGHPITADEITNYDTRYQYHDYPADNYAIPYEHHDNEGYFHPATGVDLVIPGVPWEDYNDMHISPEALIYLIPQEAIDQLKQEIVEHVNSLMD